MNISGTTYVYRESPAHAFDARAKIIVLVVYSVAVMTAHTWAGLAICTAVALVCALLSKIDARTYAAALRPVLPIAAIILASNVIVGLLGFGPDPSSAVASGLFLTARILVLVLGSLVMCLTTASTELADAFAWYLAPLRALHAPVDDIAMIVSLTLRFIPLLAEELDQIRAAQASRGAAVGTGSLKERLLAWISVFVPLFVGVFRKADAMAQAMDARCYGKGQRTSLARSAMRTKTSVKYATRAKEAEGAEANAEDTGNPAAAESTTAAACEGTVTVITCAALIATAILL